jgi:23S rRNA pseudouridine1911/1915/1917 synthase
MKRQSLSDRILYEDNHLIAVNKLPSEIVQGDKTGDVPLSEDVKQYIKERYDKPGNVYLGVIHRLDRPVSGVVVFARTSKALARMNKLVHDREMKKIYWAIVKNRPEKEEGELRHFLFRNEQKNKSFAYLTEKKGTKEAILTYRLINSSKDYYLLEVNLKTGRHHQIRAQLAAIGCPIKGDLKYGFPRSNKDASISLHARLVSFIHPVTKEFLTITARPPEDALWNYFSG